MPVTPGAIRSLSCTVCCYYRLPSGNFVFFRPLHLIATQSVSTMPRKKGKGGSKGRRWVEKPNSDKPSTSSLASSAASESIKDRLNTLGIADNSKQPSISFGSINAPLQGEWKPKSSGVRSSHTTPDVDDTAIDQTTVSGNGTRSSSSGKPDAVLSKFFDGSLLDNFSVDKPTYSTAKIRAAFYPKFENEKSDQEVRNRMIQMVSQGLATMEVSLKHSGSLFMYAGHMGGAYAKNSYGNIYTAVGVFVLGRTFVEAWGAQASKKQSEFNEFLEQNRMCISMELVTAVLGDHGQRPLEDYVVVTAVTQLGCGKPKFYSTPDIIAFCRTWRLPTNHVWLFSTRKSAMSFFASYDALCEEGTATPVCKALDEVADISIPGSVDHLKVQGEILEGLVARIVSHDSSEHMKQVLREYPPVVLETADQHLGPSLREICAANRTEEDQQIKALLESVGTSFCPNYVDWFGNEAACSHSRNADLSIVSKFLQSQPADFSTSKLQEMVRLMKERRFPAAFKCYHNFHKINTVASDDLEFKMVIHVHSDSTFRRYQKEMRNSPGLWPLYRGFFIDLNLFKADKKSAREFSKETNAAGETWSDSNGESAKDGLADEDANMMVKLKFLTYKIRTFLIRNGLSILFKQREAGYKAYYMSQLQKWNTSASKGRELSKMLDEWAVFILRKCGHKQLSSSTYLSEAEPFLEQYAKRNAQNQALIGSAGSFVRSEDFLALVEGGRDEEDDIETEKDTPSRSTPAMKDAIRKDHGFIVFFPGVPGCAKSALCKEMLSAPRILGDDRPVHSLMGDLIKGKYWSKVSEEHRKKPHSILFADKNAPNEEVWRQIEDLCRSTKASAVPVVPDSEGTESNPFSLDALGVFIFRVLQRVNHPGNLDKSSPNAGFVLLMFYHLYDGKSRNEFETELIERFGSLVKMPLLESGRPPMPEDLRSTLDKGINLYKLHSRRHGRSDSTKGTYAGDWVKWEKQLRESMRENAGYLNSIQVPFEISFARVLEQLKAIAGGEYTPPSSEKQRFGTIVFAAVNLPVCDILGLLDNLGGKNPIVEDLLKKTNIKSSLYKAHVTLAHKRSHGVTAVANYAPHLHQQVPVHMTALLFSDKLAALEVDLGIVDGEKLCSKNEWPHVTLWTSGIQARNANTLPELLEENKAIRVEINPPITITGILEFH